MTRESSGPMKSPPHPGRAGARGRSTGAWANGDQSGSDPGHSRPNLSLFLNERIDLSPELALKLEAAFGLEARMLLGMQTDYSLARARERQAEITANVRPVSVAA